MVAAAGAFLVFVIGFNLESGSGVFWETGFFGGSPTSFVLVYRLPFFFFFLDRYVQF